jgi:hypothetical protein
MQRFDDAIAQLGRAARIEPAFPAIQLGLWGAHWCARRFREALGAAGRFFELIGDAPTRAALQPCDDEESYRRAMRKAADVLSSRAAGAHVPAVRIARVLVHAGEDERAVDWLEEAFARRESPLVHLQVGWDWQHLRGRARFERLIREMRFPQPATLSISSSSRRPTPESARRSSS